jgi:2-polyprenyl-6-methoxyphenol hydroxylase-like FAD-dependent oxidoreductase
MLPWGVAEARDLGVEQTLLGAGGRVSPTWIHYDAFVPLDVARANPIPVGQIRPDIAGSMNLRHPEACAALFAAASSAGAIVMRGVGDVRVEPGTQPHVRAVGPDGAALEFAPRVIVGADGRNSTVRRQAGISLEHYDATCMIAGVIVDNLGDMPRESDILASTDDLFMASFLQHDDQLRVYLCPGLKQKNRFAGPNGITEFLRSANFGCLPFGENIAHSTPIGPLATYPGDDSWTEQPYAPGVVLIGDAAGYNNPIIGEGLSIAMRDARMVRDALRSGERDVRIFEAYAQERVERMRRLRNAAIFFSATFADDCDNRPARRAKFFELMQHEPLMMAMLGGTMGGPEQAPPEAFDGRLTELIRAA